jgi:hypothetical protein
MKWHLIVPALGVVVGLVACSKESSVPATSATPVETAPVASAPPETEGLSHLPDQLTAEEIQARREAWVRAPSGASASTRASPSTGASAATGTSADSRVAAAPAPARE